MRRVLERIFTVPRLGLCNSASATATRYAKMSPAEEVADAQAAFESLRCSGGRPLARLTVRRSAGGA
jgi:hypothetical protein